MHIVYCCCIISGMMSCFEIRSLQATLNFDALLLFYCNLIHHLLSSLETNSNMCYTVDHLLYSEFREVNFRSVSKMYTSCAVAGSFLLFAV